MLAVIQAFLARLFGGTPASGTGEAVRHNDATTPTATHPDRRRQHRQPLKRVYYPVPRAINRIVVHHSATPADRDIGVAQIAEWHSLRGFSNVGYHFVIRRDGKAETGRPLAIAGAHTKGFNADSIGICLVGGVEQHLKPQNNFTPRQLATLATLLDDLLLTWPDAEICGHKDLAATECPAFDVKAWRAGNGD